MKEKKEKLYSSMLSEFKTKITNLFLRTERNSLDAFSITWEHIQVSFHLFWIKSIVMQVRGTMYCQYKAREYVSLRNFLSNKLSNSV